MAHAHLGAKATDNLAVYLFFNDAVSPRDNEKNEQPGLNGRLSALRHRGRREQTMQKRDIITGIVNGQRQLHYSTALGVLQAFIGVDRWISAGKWPTNDNPKHGRVAFRGVWSNRSRRSDRLNCEIVCLESISAIPANQWDEMAGDHPLVSHAYLEALETTHCAVPRTGWAPHHLVLLRDGRPRAAMPLYLKNHSRGEYVFDYAWAEAYSRYGIPYYPKLLSAVPFTPVPGPRLLAHDRKDQRLLLDGAIYLLREHGYSSLHILFPPQEDLELLEDTGFMLRHNVQFHWENRSYPDMNGFLADLTQSKRKKLRQDRRKVAAAGIRFKWLTGKEIDHATLRFLYLCYVQTYLEHGNAPYLNLDFFERIHDRNPDALVVIVAEREGRPIAAALNIRHGHKLYGRYWGCTEHVPGLHFETCYLQGIEYCIARGISVFEGGAQGEHKLARGMLPVVTYSAHWIEDPVFRPAIADFLQRETPVIQRYYEELLSHSPYRLA